MARVLLPRTMAAEPSVCNGRPKEICKRGLCGWFDRTLAAQVAVVAE
jgi:hypothetical protein